MKNTASTSDPSDQNDPSMKLGEVSVNNHAFELDLKINEGYQSYSAELLRLALLVLTGLGVVWIRLYFAHDCRRPRESTGVILGMAFVCAAAAAGAALVHRYFAADGLGYHLTAMRMRARNRPAGLVSRSDYELAMRQDRVRGKLFRWSTVALRCSIGCLLAGLVLFCAAMATLMFAGGSRLAPEKRPQLLFMNPVKSDHCSTRNARMSRTDTGNHGNAFNAFIAITRLARSSFSLM
jgi:hypothetical protein